MKRWWLAGIAIVLAVPWALALDDPKKDDAKKDKPVQEKPATVEEQVKAIEQEMQTKRAELLKRYREATEPDEKQKIVKEFNELQSSLGERALELAKKHAKESGGFAALKLALNFADTPEGRTELVKLLIDNHVETAGIGEIAVYLSSDPAGMKFLQAVVDRNKNRDDQGKALFAIGMLHKRKVTEEGAAEADRTKAIADATKAFDTLKAKFADLDSPFGGKTLGATAAAQLAGLKNIPLLVVGKTVPELVGEDTDGVEFKISDYRGKVVFVDYWAYW